jgi:hypothetical protein
VQPSIAASNTAVVANGSSGHEHPVQLGAIDGLVHETVADEMHIPALVPRLVLGWLPVLPSNNQRFAAAGQQVGGLRPTQIPDPELDLAKFGYTRTVPESEPQTVATQHPVGNRVSQRTQRSQYQLIV